ncbi:MAG TPA: DUF2071 domain-containing protein [Gemmatimonadaceae bacterium]|nr:DUF2071 domain-containing protein [Gemmatimonadaceae bacterium]
MAQRWTDLLFAHWPIDASILRALVPASLPVDTFDGSGWLSIASFYLSHLRPRWLPALPRVSEFPELNVRTYVSLGGKPGVYFFSLDAGSSLAVAAARATYHLPYFNARMSIATGDNGAIHYRSTRVDRRASPANFAARYRPTGPVVYAASGTLDHWLTERYCLYAVDSASRVHRAEIHHHRWPLQPVEVSIAENTMAAAGGMQLPATPPRLSYARSLDVVVWWPTTLRL